MSSSGGAAAIRRIQRELKEINEDPSLHWAALPANDDLFEWSFAIRGPPATEFEGGIYTGRIALPVNYPLAPPSIMMLTPSGRWEVGKKICLSNSNYHPELWQPAWGIRTMMEALRGHFPVPGDGAIGALDWPTDLREKLAKESLDFVCSTFPGGNRRNRELLTELSPEQLREDKLVLDPPAVVEPEAATPTAATAAPETLAAPQPQAVEDESSGLRQRRGGEAAESTAAAAAPEPSGVQAAAPALPAANARRRRDDATGARTQRRPAQPMLLQLLTPPQTKREFILLVIHLLIALLFLSMCAIITDMVKHPPKILHAQQ